MRILSIGQLAKQSGVGVETIRFYERRGLIAEPARRPSSGYRQYPVDAVRRIRFIRRAKELGFTLGEIQDLLELEASPRSTCADVRVRAEVKLADVHQKIQDLQRIERVLATLAKSCRGSGPTDSCPILAALDQGSDHENHS